MAKNKTTENNESVVKFLKQVKDEKKREDCLTLVKLLSAHTGFEAKMWGAAIVGFGTYHYKYDSGREGDAPLMAFSPRSSSIALYFSAELEKRAELLEKLGKHKADKGCVHIKSLEDVSLVVLKKLVENNIKYYKKKYPSQ